jgi:hypothetical protein
VVVRKWSTPIYSQHHQSRSPACRQANGRGPERPGGGKCGHFILSSAGFEGERAQSCSKLGSQHRRVITRFQSASGRRTILAGALLRTSRFASETADFSWSALLAERPATSSLVRFIDGLLEDRFLVLLASFVVDEHLVAFNGVVYSR